MARVWSPRVRGCSLSRLTGSAFCPVVPARAGLFPGSSQTGPVMVCGPRACGVVPRMGPPAARTPAWSPRVRGCSGWMVPIEAATMVVPARAGLFPTRVWRGRRCGCGPRACGVVPYERLLNAKATAWSPRVRGCSRLPGRAALHRLVVPARAGLFPSARRPTAASDGGPRACGVVPGWLISQITRGAWSPRVRGCSLLAQDAVLAEGVVPARAGLFPRPLPVVASPLRGPRACGVVPSSSMRRPSATRWSPRVRGCSPCLPQRAWWQVVVPARAGLFPRTAARSAGPAGGPRACGVVPAASTFPEWWPRWSPRVRGCSHHAGRHPDESGVVPARAGLFPRARWPR